MMLTHIPDTPTGFTRAVSHTSAPWSFPNHRHNGFLELVYVHIGAFDHIVGGHLARQSRGELLLVRADDGHALQVGPEEMMLTNLQISNQWLRQMEGLWECPSLLAGPLSKPAPLLARLPAAEQPAFEQALDGLDAPPSAEGRRAVFSGFLIRTLLRYFADPNLLGIGQERMPQWLENTVSWIHRRREQPIRVADIVEHANKCPEHISRSFVKHLKMTPSQYINRQKLDYAAELLAGTNFALLEICYRAGFDNPSYFHRLFKKHYGMPPIAYRKANTRLESS